MLQGPGVVPLFGIQSIIRCSSCAGVCVSPPEIYVVYGLCERGTLQMVLEGLLQRWKLPKILSAAADILVGVCWLHSKRFIHRSQPDRDEHCAET